MSPGRVDAALSSRCDDDDDGVPTAPLGVTELPLRRLVRSHDFERVLRTRSRASSPHFAVHHVADRPHAAWMPAVAPGAAAGPDLSTVEPSVVSQAVDRSPPDAVWLGAVVPKRHARRAVTRTLLKRQIRGVVGARCDDLAHGLWVVRLRAPFDRTLFPSAASDALKRLARSELDQLLAAASARAGRR